MWSLITKLWTLVQLRFLFDVSGRQTSPIVASNKCGPNSISKNSWHWRVKPLAHSVSAMLAKSPCGSVSHTTLILSDSRKHFACCQFEDVSNTFIISSDIISRCNAWDSTSSAEFPQFLWHSRSPAYHCSQMKTTEEPSVTSMNDNNF